MWVRDRLAGMSTQCPSCKSPLTIPDQSVVEATMTASRCTCGELFWARNWRPGRKCRCPLCGNAVGDKSDSKPVPQVLPTPSGPVSAALHPASVLAQPSPTRAMAPTISGSGDQHLLTRNRAWLPIACGAAGALAVLLIGTLFWPKQPAAPVSIPPAVTTGTGAASATAALSNGGGQSTTPPPATHEPDRVAETAQELNPPQPAGTTPATGIRLIVPAYFYPSGKGLEDWERMNRAAARVPLIAIANPSSGPGLEQNPDYRQAITAAERAGVQVVGYVNTEYARRPRSVVEGEITRWLEFYPDISGFFFDAQASQATDAHLEYYLKLRDFVRARKPKALIIANPGTICEQGFLEQATADVVVCFENSEGFAKFELPSWTEMYPSARFAALPYNVADTATLRLTLQEAVIKGIKDLYITGHSGVNPWNGLPEYWETEVEMVQKLNARQAF